jgi:UDP-N-acetylmuramoyl-L-alanyl-D-glutamate--2,6-diaminopimelate ligase
MDAFKRLSFLANTCNARLVQGDGDVHIIDVVEDSRQVTPGSLFIARAGGRHDGCSYIDEAIRRGAAAILTAPGAVRSIAFDVAWIEAADPAKVGAQMADFVHGIPGAHLQLVGITGTKGKTTTAYLVREILQRDGRICGLMGTVENHDGLTARPAVLTTPAGCDISRFLRTMLHNGCTAAVMEVSSHALALQRVAGPMFAIGAFTNLSGDHLDFHGTMEAYADAKAILFERLLTPAFAVVNADDPAAARMIRDTRATVVRCSTAGTTADFSAADITLDGRGSHFTLSTPHGDIDITLPLLGRYNVANAVLAAAIASSLGVSLDIIAAALAHAVGPPGRFERVGDGDEGYTVLVDYAHTDASLDSALAALRPLVRRGASLRVVFGCGGDRDRTKRPRMAAAACRHADHVIITSDNPRTESPRAIIDEILTGVDLAGSVKTEVFVDRREAIHAAIRAAQPGDILLIAGKGHEDYQIIGDQKRPFDDRLVAREAMLARSSSTSAA